MPGDSGAPVIIEKYGKVFYLGVVRSLDKESQAIIPLWGQAEDAALFNCPGELNMIEETGARKHDLTQEQPLGGDYYAFGTADSVPHIHSYPGGFHLKILSDRNKIERIDIVKNSIFLKENLESVFTAIDSNSLPLKQNIKSSLKQALLDEVKKYKFQYTEEPDDFEDLNAFKAFLKQKKIKYTLL